MAEKTVSLDETLFEVTERYPDLVETLFAAGFMGVKNEAMRNSHGRQMTLRAGCGHLGINEGTLKSALEAKGYAVKG